MTTDRVKKDVGKIEAQGIFITIHKFFLKSYVINRFASSLKWFVE
jgi:hypothetical protein